MDNANQNGSWPFWLFAVLHFFCCGLPLILLMHWERPS